MVINDVVYGGFEVNEPVLIELINSKPVQRLKGIEQYGVPKHLYLFPGFTRYDHSIGVMILLRKLGASIDEQIAGLLHDISHTAFSHMFDWVVGSSEKENYQDKNHHNILFDSEVPKILLNYGFSAEKITNHKKFSLLERELPDLCADRIDYALREFHYWADKEAVLICLENIRVYDGKIVFSSKRSALKFAKNFLKCQSVHWGGADAVLRYHLFSEVLKIALSEETIILDDFYQDDSFIMRKLERSKNPLIKKILKSMSFGRLHFKINNKNPKLKLKKKFRHVNPLYMENEVLYRLSEQDDFFKNMLERERKINEFGINADLVL